MSLNFTRSKPQSNKHLLLIISKSNNLKFLPLISKKVFITVKSWLLTLCRVGCRVINVYYLLMVHVVIILL